MKLIVTTFFLFCFFTSKAQDIIVLRDGSELKVIVKEILQDQVKYKKLNNQTGPSYSLGKIKIFKIKYKNSTEEFYGDYREQSNTSNKTNQEGNSTKSTIVTRKTTSPTPRTQQPNQRTTIQERSEVYNQPKAPTSYKSSNSSSKDIKIGVLGGLNIANVSESTSSSLTTFHVGAFTELPTSENTVLQVALLYSVQGATVLKSNVTYDRVPISTESTLSLSYLKIPIYGLYKIGGFKIGAGPYLAFQLSKSIKSKYSVTSISEEITQAKYPNTYASLESYYVENVLSKIDKTIDFGVGLSAQYEIDNGLIISAGYSRGLTAIENSPSNPNKNTTLSIGVGYFFK